MNITETLPVAFAIVIPAYNRERFIGPAIESALSQTVPADEIIVVDDGSTDRTAQVARSYGSQVAVLSIENNGAGPSRPRNVAIAAARSSYITLLDSDDLLDESVIERHRKIVTAHPGAGLICANYYTAVLRRGVIERTAQNDAIVVRRLPKESIGDRTYLIRSHVAYPAYCRANFIKTPATTFPKVVWNDVGGYDETLRTSNDYDFFIRVLSRYDVVYIDLPLHTIVHHTENISAANVRGEFNDEHWRNHIRVLKRELRCERGRRARYEIRSSLSSYLRQLGCEYRHARRYKQSLACYAESCRYRLPRLTDVRAFPRVLLRGWARR